MNKRSGPTPDGTAGMQSPADFQRLARDPAITEEQQLFLLSKSWSFVHLALADNPATTATVLRALAATDVDSAWNENALLLAIASHANSDREALRVALARTVRALENGQRPYQASVALAKRPELLPVELAPLHQGPGVSRTQKARVRDTLGTRA